MNADIFSYEGEGIQCVYDNKNWVMCIKNWKPNNDIENIRYLEVHHATDEQFVLLKGKAVLLAAVEEDAPQPVRTPAHRASAAAAAVTRCQFLLVALRIV